MAVDERLLGALHVEVMRRDDVHAERDPHAVFQASTVAELVDGEYDGDVDFAELARHGDLGLGTTNGVDGEMIALDGRFMRADIEGTIHDIDPATRTPFAVLVRFSPTHEFDLTGRLANDDFLASIDRRVGDPDQVHALRLDGRFERVHARSVPRQTKPYPPMDEIVANQHTFDFSEVEGTMVGFRFPDYAKGVNVPGYHLHFVTADRTRGGHVLECSPDGVRVQVDDASDLQVELPAGISFAEASAASEDAVNRLEHQG